MLQEKTSFEKFALKYNKAQKIITWLTFLCFILLFIYCLAFFTPFFELESTNRIWGKAFFQKFGVYDMYGKDLAGLAGPENLTNTDIFMLNDGNITGINIAYFTRYTVQVQAFNHLLFYFSIAGIILSLTLFIYRFAIRRRYYITNYVVCGIYSIFSVVSSIFLLTQMISWHSKLYEINFDIINRNYSQASNFNEVVQYFSPATFEYIYYVGYALIAIILLITASFILLNVCKAVEYKDWDERVKKYEAEQNAKLNN